MARSGNALRRQAGAAHHATQPASTAGLEPGLHRVLRIVVVLHAIDAGRCTDLSGDPVTTDQRGVARPQGVTCDIGAYEVKPAFPFSGFLAPVDDLPIVNAAKAGAAIPVKFSLSGNRGLNIVAADAPVPQQVSCSGADPISEIEQTVTAGANSLSYDAAKDVYSYVWKTATAWKGTCRQLILKLTDDTTQVATFQFK